MKHRAPLAAAALLPLVLSSGCAIANRGTLQLSRHISIGQELIDLQRAHVTGAINDEEYAMLKGKLMALVDSIEVVEAVNDYTPDQVTADDADADADDDDAPAEERESS